MGVQVDGGKDILPLCGEFNPGLVAKALHGGRRPRRRRGPPARRRRTADADLPDRPPTLCPGCSHRGVFVALRKLRAYVSGDIGCYSLGALAAVRRHALQHVHGRRHQHGPRHGQGHGQRGRRARTAPVAVIGDSTFFHSGITSLLDVAYNRSNVVTVILDNRTTAMTGGQENPSMGKTLQGKDARRSTSRRSSRSWASRACARSTPTTSPRCEAVLKEEIAADEPSVVIATSPCVLQYRIKRRGLLRSTPTSAPAARSACAPGAPPSACTRTRTTSRESRSTPPRAPAAACARSSAGTRRSSPPASDDGKDA